MAKKNTEIKHTLIEYMGAATIAILAVGIMAIFLSGSLTNSNTVNTEASSSR